MSAVELEKWMKKNGLTAVDIASALKMHPNTILKYLKGAPARRSTIAAFERYVASYSNNNGYPAPQRRYAGV